MSEKDIENRLIELESRMAFQDDIIAVLNDQVADQQLEIQKLWEANRLMRDHVESLKSSDIRSLDEEVPPPHY
ncbi:SlyX family protein [Mangrovitalea sediminis]|uniref:SlyX family protein n=1 Tax=Mangrovitalea sediminis TaxID=1982043 RepID=UPI000BE4FCB6|nr:SlyX family protein [Mangrovitalea sediminis]